MSRLCGIWILREGKLKKNGGRKKRGRKWTKIFFFFLISQKIPAQRGGCNAEEGGIRMQRPQLRGAAVSLDRSVGFDRSFSKLIKLQVLTA